MHACTKNLLNNQLPTKTPDVAIFVRAFLEIKKRELEAGQEYTFWHIGLMPLSLSGLKWPYMFLGNGINSCLICLKK